jgi:hypothetical protein
MPIIVGVPRSGTTLLRLMLDAHSELAVTHEAGFIPAAANLANPLSRMFYRRLRHAIKGGSWSNSLREAFYRTVTEVNNWNDFHVPGENFRQALMQNEPFTVSEGLRTFFQLYARRFGKPRWGDKTPFYNQYLKTIAGTLPEAHFIHIIRDGRDAALSGKGLPFVAGDFEAIGRNWSQQILNTRRQARACCHYLEIRYEDLLVKTTDILQKICVFIDLSYEPGMELYYQQAPERMAELGNTYNADGSVAATREARLHRHRLTAQPPEPTRIGRWKTEMTKEELVRFNQVAGALLKELGYEE